MAKARNKVIAGDFEGSPVGTLFGDVKVAGRTISKYQVESYELMTEEKMKSGTSAVFRGAAGVAVLGPVGMLAGLSAKNKEINTVAILWRDGKKSLIEVDGKIYKKIIAAMF